MKELAMALIKAQNEMPRLLMDATATIRHKSGGQHSYNYPSLPNVLDTIMESLRANGILVMQYPHTKIDSGVVMVSLSTLLVHSESGETFEPEPLTLVAASLVPQDIGVAITYARRYSLVSIMGLAAEDNDGAPTSKQSPPAKQVPAKSVAKLPTKPMPSSNGSGKCGLCNAPAGMPHATNCPNANPVKSLDDVPEIDPDVGHDFTGMFDEVEFSEFATDMIITLRDASQSVDKAMSPKQYGYMCSLIDGVCGENMHRFVLQVLFGDNEIPGWKAKDIIDWVKDKDEETIQAIGEINAKIIEVLGQPA